MVSTVCTTGEYNEVSDFEKRAIVRVNFEL